jgi:hypothetical protein
MIDALAFWADHPLMTNVKHHPSITGWLQFDRLAGPRPWPVVDLASSATLQGARAQLDLSRFCAAPLITYCAAKEMNHEHRQDG